MLNRQLKNNLEFYVIIDLIFITGISRIFFVNTPCFFLIVKLKILINNKQKD